MRKFINYLILLLLFGFLYSCKINISDSKDGGGNGSSVSITNPYPNNGAIEIPLTLTLYWDVQCNNTNVQRYDIYLDISNPPSDSIASVYTNSYNITTPLEGNKTYYWQIRAICDNGGDTCSEVWRFTTTAGGIPTNGMVAYYPFNGSANDESGYGNHGQNNGASLMSDRFSNPNKAYSFNGVNSSIIVPHTQYLQPTNGLTISAWIKFNSLNSISSILAKGSDTTKGWYSFRYEPANPSLDFQINFSDYTGGPRKTVSVNSTINVNVWYNIIGTYDGNVMQLYFNGLFYNAISVSSALGSNYGNLQIGSSAEGYFLNGALDDIRIYNRALTHAELQQLYHEGGWQ